jgi:hypothetical protein
MPFVLIVLTVFLVAAVVLWVLEVRVGNNRTSAVVAALGKSKDFCLWLVLSVQFMSCSLASSAAGLPEWVMYVYAVIGFFSFDSSAVSFEGCDHDSSYPFTVPLVTLIVGLSLIALQGTLALVKLRFARADEIRKDLQLLSEVLPETLSDEHHDAAERASAMANPTEPAAYRWASVAQGGVFLVLNALYSLMSKTSLRFLHCRSVDGSGESSFPVPGAPFVRCFSGDHLAVGVLSIVTLITLVVGMPIFTFAYICRHKLHQPSVIRGCEQGLSPTWNTFVAGDFNPHHFFVRHIGCAVQVTGQYFAVGFTLVRLKGALPSAVLRLVCWRSTSCSYRRSYVPF